MIEKVITLENISLVEFLGPANTNINRIAAAFPKSKIVSRGNEIKLRGETSEVIKINEVVQLLIDHLNRYGSISEETIDQYLGNSGGANDYVGDDAVEDNIVLYANGGLRIKARSENQRKLVRSATENDITFAVGPAGTGKTYLTVALAVRALKNKRVKKIIITRPAVEAGESLGFLPGDLKDKVDPYLRPIYDALDDMIPPEKLNFYKENGIIEIAPLAYMRGRTLNNAYVILDEAQNTTPMQIKMFLTRLGAQSKMIITGDVTQIDLPRHQQSGLIESIKILRNINEIGTVYLEQDDVVRHKLVSQIIDAYEVASKEQ